MLLQVSEIPKCLPADFENLLEVDGVDTSLAGLEGDYPEGNLLVEIGEIGGQHDIRQVEVLGHLPEILFHQIALHQPERGVGVRDADAKGELQYESQGILDELP